MKREIIVSHAGSKPDENGVKNKAPAQDQAADLHKPSQPGDANQADSQCSHLTTATTTNGKNLPTEQT